MVCGDGGAVEEGRLGEAETTEGTAVVEGGGFVSWWWSGSRRSWKLRRARLAGCEGLRACDLMKKRAGVGVFKGGRRGGGATQGEAPASGTAAAANSCWRWTPAGGRGRTRQVGPTCRWLSEAAADSRRKRASEAERLRVRPGFGWALGRGLAWELGRPSRGKIFFKTFFSEN